MNWLALLRRGILASPPPLGRTLLWMAAAVAIPTGVKALLGPGVSGALPFATYYPAVLGATLFLGWRAATVTTLLSAWLVNRLFITPRFSLASSPSDFATVLLFLATAGTVIAVAEALRRTLIQLDSAARRETGLNAELQHRVKNNLAVVQALALQTARTAPDAERFYPAFVGRLNALAQAHDILTAGLWETCEMPELALTALGPFRNQGQIKIAGPALVLPTASCVPLVLALHELGTNAVKYGALSTAEGGVNVTWSLSPDGRMALRWEEFGGPTVTPPTHNGVGSKLLFKQAELASVALEFRSSGVVCDIAVDGARPPPRTGLLAS
jgi:two-component sensor histidine kinase